MRGIILTILASIALSACSKSDYFTFEFKNESSTDYIGVSVDFENNRGFVCGSLTQGKRGVGMFMPGPYSGKATVNWIIKGTQEELSKTVDFERSEGQNYFMIIFTDSGIVTQSKHDEY